VKITTAVIPIERYQFLHFMIPNIFSHSNKPTPNCRVRKSNIKNQWSWNFFYSSAIQIKN